MKPHFKDLPIEVQQSFGDGCTFVPDFIFTANCRHHDWNYSVGGGLGDKLKADLDMCRYMWADSSKVWHYLVTTLYYFGLTFLPISYFFFEWGEYRDAQRVIAQDRGYAV